MSYALDICLSQRGRKQYGIVELLAKVIQEGINGLERFGHCPGGENSSSKFDLSYSLHSKEGLIHSLFGLAFHWLIAQNSKFELGFHFQGVAKTLY